MFYKVVKNFEKSSICLNDSKKLRKDPKKVPSNFKWSQKVIRGLLHLPVIKKLLKELPCI